MATHAATILRVEHNGRPRAVVTHADPVIWIAPDLLTQIRDPHRPRIPGDMHIGGHTITMGTEGEGLGQLTYRLRPGTVHDPNGPEQWHIADQVTNSRS